MNKLRKHGVYYDSRIKLLLILLTSALAFALGMFIPLELNTPCYSLASFACLLC